MKLIVTINILSVILGLATLSGKGLTHSDRAKVTEIGPPPTHRETKRTYLFSPILTGIGQTGRIMLTLLGRKAQ